MTDNIIEINNVSFIYKNHNDEEILALNNITTEIKRGEFVVVLGKNGSGKSTYARLMNGLLTPTSGVVKINGLSTENDNNIWEIRKNLGLIFQNPDNQIIATSVEEDVAFGPENIGVPPKEIIDRVQKSLEIVDLKEYMKHSSHKLSGGQKQRLCIAGVLAMNPKCIVLDEATAMLDPVGRAKIIDLLRKLNKEKGITIIHITHHMDEAVQADRLIVMDSGKVMYDDTPKNVFYNVEKLRSIGLSVPNSCELCFNLAQKEIIEIENVLTVDEAVNCISSYLNCCTCKSLREKTYTDNNNEVVIKVKGLSHTYMKDTPYEKQALKDINLSINKTGIVGIIGHTGSGKSTLVQHFNGLIKPQQGEVHVCGIDISSKEIKELRKKVGLIFQYPEHQLFEETVYKDIEFGLIKNGSVKDYDEIIKKTINLVGLNENILYKSPFELSGGQKRRVAIAGVLVMQPEILVLDEPTAGLDPQGSKEIYELLENYKNEHKATIIVVSHSMEDIAEHAEYVYVMNKGQIKFEGKPVDVFMKELELKKIGLDIPETMKIFKKLHHKYPFVSEKVFTVKQAEEQLIELLDRRN